MRKTPLSGVQTLKADLTAAGKLPDLAGLKRQLRKGELLPAPEAASQRKASTIRTFDDMALAPTEVKSQDWTGKWTVREELRAELFSELRNEKVTLIQAIAMSGNPYSTTGRWKRAFTSGDNSRGAIYLYLIGSENGTRLPSGVTSPLAPSSCCAANTILISARLACRRSRQGMAPAGTAPATPRRGRSSRLTAPASVRC